MWGSGQKVMPFHLQIYQKSVASSDFVDTRVSTLPDIYNIIWEITDHVGIENDVAITSVKFASLTFLDWNERVLLDSKYVHLARAVINHSSLSSNLGFFVHRLDVKFNNLYLK